MSISPAILRKAANTARSQPIQKTLLTPKTIKAAIEAANAAWAQPVQKTLLTPKTKQATRKLPLTSTS